MKPRLGKTPQLPLWTVTGVNSQQLDHSDVSVDRPQINK